MNMLNKKKNNIVSSVLCLVVITVLGFSCESSTKANKSDKEKISEKEIQKSLVLVDLPVAVKITDPYVSKICNCNVDDYFTSVLPKSIKVGIRSFTFDTIVGKSHHYFCFSAPFATLIDADTVLRYVLNRL